MNINQLQYFISAAESHSFTKAAAQHYISQTAVTQQIHALEETLGVELFDRKTRPIALTPAGQTFLRDAKSILERFHQAVDRVQEASIGLAGALRIGYTKGYERSNLSELLRTFHLKYPNILTTCYRCDTDQLAAGLLKDEYDLIFTWDSTELVKDETIAHRFIERSPLMVALYQNHPLAQRSSLNRRELRNENILFMSPSGTGESIGDSYFYKLYQRAGYQPNILFRSSDAESILMMVAAEAGVSILPYYVTKKLIDADNLTFIPLRGEHENMEIIAAWKRENTSPILQRFLETMKSDFIRE